MAPAPVVEPQLEPAPMQAEPTPPVDVTMNLDKASHSDFNAIEIQDPQPVVESMPIAPIEEQPAPAEET